VHGDSFAEGRRRAPVAGAHGETLAQETEAVERELVRECDAVYPFLAVPPLKMRCSI
jgi:hypothetical protein